MTDPLRSSRAKVERAKQHIYDLQVAVSAFLDTKPYAVAVQRDPQTRKPMHYLTSVRETPILIASITGDVLQNLRSALDHLAYRLVSIGTHGAGPFEHIYFPIFDTAAKYKSGKHGHVKGARPEAIKAIDMVKPYKGGNDSLWRLHKLNNIDKHRLLLTVGSAYRSLNLGAFMSREMQRAFPDKTIPVLDVFFKPADRMFPLKVGDVLFIGAPDAELDEKMEFRFDVALGEPQVIEGDPLLETVQQMADLVGNIISDFAPLAV